MLIVLACDVPLTENNGTAVAAQNLRRALEARGHTVRLLCPDAVDAMEPGPYAVPAINFGLLNRYVLQNGVVIARPAREVIRRALIGADHLHIMTPFFLCAAAVRQANELGLSVTAGFHCQAENLSNHLLLMNNRRVSRRIYRLFWRHVYSRVGGIHYPTRFIRDTFETAIGLSTPGEVISNGVGAEFTPEREPKPPALEGRFVILFTGRYSREKSHDILIRAAARCRHRDDIRLIFAGDGPRREHIKKLSASLLPTMPILGFVPRQELIHRIRYADLYVHPAEIELEAIACLEAIQGGLVPLVSDSSRSATSSFALWPENTFQCGSVQSLADRIDWWIDHPAELAKCREQYDGFAARFDRDRCMEDMERLICRTWEKAHETEKTLYYHDPLHDDFARRPIEAAPLPDGYEFIRRGSLWRAASFFVYRLLAVPVGFLASRLIYGVRVHGRRALRSVEDGVFLYINHTQSFHDAYMPLLLAHPRRNYTVVSSAAVTPPVIRTLVPMLGGLPLPGTLAGMRGFYAAMRERIDEGAAPASIEITQCVQKTF